MSLPSPVYGNWISNKCYFQISLVFLAKTGFKFMDLESTVTIFFFFFKNSTVPVKVALWGSGFQEISAVQIRQIKPF